MYRIIVGRRLQLQGRSRQCIRQSLATRIQLSFRKDGVSDSHWQQEYNLRPPLEIVEVAALEERQVVVVLLAVHQVCSKSSIE